MRCTKVTLLIMATGILISWYVSGDFAYTRFLWYWTVYFVIVSLLVDRTRRKLTNSLNTSNNLPKYRTQNYRQGNHVSPPSRPPIPNPSNTNAQKPTPLKRHISVSPNRHSNTGAGETGATHQAVTRPTQPPQPPAPGVSKINVTAAVPHSLNNESIKIKATVLDAIANQSTSMPKANNNKKVSISIANAISVKDGGTATDEKAAIIAACKAVKIDTTRNRGANFTPPTGVEFQIDSFTAATFEVPAQKDNNGNVTKPAEKHGWLRINVVANGQLYAISLSRFQGALFGASHWSKQRSTTSTSDEL